MDNLGARSATDKAGEGRWASPSRAKRHPDDEVTPRERDVLAGLMAEGLSNAGIAQHLVVTEGAFEKHVTSIIQKQRL
jgi:DNA-binding NarL/FixJ family response regulator